MGGGGGGGLCGWGVGSGGNAHLRVSCIHLQMTGCEKNRGAPSLSSTLKRLSLMLGREVIFPVWSLTKPRSGGKERKLGRFEMFVVGGSVAYRTRAGTSVIGEKPAKLMKNGSPRGIKDEPLIRSLMDLLTFTVKGEGHENSSVPRLWAGTNERVGVPICSSLDPKIVPAASETYAIRRIS